MQRCARALAATAFALGTVGLTHATLAADSPSRPIRIIAPSTPGGAAGQFARLLADQLGPPAWHDPQLSTIGPAVSGLIGIAAAAHAEPTSYTLVTSSIAYNADRTDRERQSRASTRPAISPTSPSSADSPMSSWSAPNPTCATLKDVVELARRGAPPNYVLARPRHVLAAPGRSLRARGRDQISAHSASRLIADHDRSRRRRNVPFGTMTSGSGDRTVPGRHRAPVAISSGPGREFPERARALHELGYSIISDGSSGLCGTAASRRDHAQAQPGCRRSLGQARGSPATRG